MSKTPTLRLASPLTAVAALCAVLTAPLAQAATIEVLHAFVPGTCNQPLGNPLRQPDGTLYGTCYGGGVNGSGIAYRLNPDGQFILLHEFDNSFQSEDGKLPISTLVMAPDGKLWGATHEGGELGVGTVYSLTTGGTFALAFSFDTPTTGSGPEGNLAIDSAGVLYGNNYEGGGGKSHGTAYSFSTSSGTQTTLARYTTALGPISPTNGLTLGPDGMLYGAAADPHRGGNGELFRMNRDGSGFQQLALFKRTTSGAQPRYGVTVLADGTVYGVNTTDGAAGKGVIYRWRSSDGLTVMHTFTGGTGDAEQANSSLTQGADGALYGTSRFGGTNRTSNGGTVYRMALDGSFSLVRSFNATDAVGFEPTGGLTLGADGALYGVTNHSASDEYAGGAIFRIVP
ncbi:hypothetical protein LRH25_15225 [Ideonella azotifigens]|uniref:Uncharacterized protein n=1 Tax=Ideonella azotifigens TaxID=513160 RepID=A0ABN1K1E0_9BURK|nr:choice-of-anchor tandem repeat GloVer-containing protein [Ideonella azotifigens]MCD2341695.1 hypothetical protein [Ideonella azotifigens]